MLGVIIHKQRIIGDAIGIELDSQNEILAEIGEEFERVEGKVGVLEKRLGRLM
jgi:hypothetical protein